MKEVLQDLAALDSKFQPKMEKVIVVFVLLQCVIVEQLFGVTGESFVQC